MAEERLLTTVVGSYPQPDWLIDRQALAEAGVPRIRTRSLWRVPVELLAGAQDDASLLAIRDMERCGIDIISDGEARRESYSNHFATALEGIDQENPGTVMGRAGGQSRVPRIVGPIRRSRPVLAPDVEFLRRNTGRRIKMTIPGPFTMSQQAQNEHYPDLASLALDYAAAVNQEVKEMFAAGADVVQIDEPWIQARWEQAREYGIAAIDKALDGVTGTTALHMCFGYAAMVKDKPNRYSFLTDLEASSVNQISIEAAQPGLDLSVLAELPTKTVILGVLDLGDMNIETPETVAGRIREALQYISPERLQLAPDCGMKYLPRDVALGKLLALTAGARMVRKSLG